MADRALAFGFGGYADLDLTFGEFFANDHTVMVRFMPQHPYAGPGPILAENGGGTYMVGQGDFNWGNADPTVPGPSTLFVQVGGTRVTYDVPGFVNEIGGPVGYREVWQHLAIVRQGQAMRLYLNGQLLTGNESSSLAVPGSGSPGADVTLRLGRRTAGSKAENLYWQFFGLIDDVAVYTNDLSAAAIQAAAAATLTGDEDGLLAGWTFDTGSKPSTLSRAATLPTEANIPEHVNEHAAQPVPVYFVTVSADRDSSADRAKLDIRPSKVRTTLPFGAGEWWKVGQGWEDPRPNLSHRAITAAFCFDFNRVNGDTFGATVRAAAPARVIYAAQDEGEGAMSVYHGPFERAVYMHLRTGFYSKYFPDETSPPEGLPVSAQPTYALGDHIAEVGHHPNGDHLHFVTSSINGETFADAGPSQPNALEDYYVSKDKGKTWTKVERGIPAHGEWVSRYPWSPWGDRGDILAVAPAVASWAAGRLDVFVRGENDHLWHMSWNGATWSAWEDLGGGRLTSAPAAVSWGLDRIDVFVRGSAKQLAHKRWNGAEWSEWRDLGGKLTSAPAAASWAPDRLDVFARGENNHLWHKSWNGEKWSSWVDRGGGTLTSAPAAVSWGPDRIDVFVRGSAEQLAHKRWNGAEWSEWRNLGGRLTSAPAVASWGTNRLDVFVRGFEGTLAHKRWNGQDWSEWRNLGGRLTSSPGTASWGPNRIDVFVRGFEHQLAQKRWTDDKGWSEWRDLDRG